MRTINLANNFPFNLKSNPYKFNRTFKKIHQNLQILTIIIITHIIIINIIIITIIILIFINITMRVFIIIIIIIIFIIHKYITALWQ